MKCIPEFVLIVFKASHFQVRPFLCVLISSFGWWKVMLAEPAKYFGDKTVYRFITLCFLVLPKQEIYNYPYESVPLHPALPFVMMLALASTDVKGLSWYFVYHFWKVNFGKLSCLETGLLSCDALIANVNITTSVPVLRT